MTKEERFWSKVDKSGDCWIWTGKLDPKGYGRAHLPGDKSTGVHRMAWELTFGKIEGELFACHKCDNPPCVNPNHLFLGTQTDNIRDCVGKGRLAHQRPQGIESGRAKLRNDQVFGIVEEYRDGNVTQLELARKYGVNYRTISSIVTGAGWKHLGAA